MALPYISIIDIIKIKRTAYARGTENKSCYVLTCRTEGEGLFFYSNETLSVRKGDILYIPLGSSYFQKCDRETIVCFHLNVSGQISSRFEAFTPEDPDRICSLFLRAEELWRRKPPNYELLCMSILYEILAGTGLSAEEHRHESSELLKPAMAYLDAHLCSADLSLCEMCARAHISRTYLNQLFRRIYGQTPISYVNERRIERARQLLRSGDCSTEEVAALCGFRDVKYFYVVFKRLSGMTTREYKRQSADKIPEKPLTDAHADVIM